MHQLRLESAMVERNQLNVGASQVSAAAAHLNCLAMLQHYVPAAIFKRHGSLC